MTEEEFRKFLEGQNLPKEKFENTILEVSDAQFLLRVQGKSGGLTEEQLRALAAETRKRFAVSISLASSGIATPEDLLSE